MDPDAVLGFRSSRVWPEFAFRNKDHLDCGRVHIILGPRLGNILAARIFAMHTYSTR